MKSKSRKTGGMRCFGDSDLACVDRRGFTDWMPGLQRTQFESIRGWEHGSAVGYAYDDRRGRRPGWEQRYRHRHVERQRKQRDGKLGDVKQFGVYRERTFPTVDVCSRAECVV